jgi:hypothetical protein
MSIGKPRKDIKNLLQKFAESFGVYYQTIFDLKPLYPQTIIVNISPYKTLRTQCEKPLNFYIRI